MKRPGDVKTMLPGHQNSSHDPEALSSIAFIPAIAENSDASTHSHQENLFVKS